MSKFHSESLYLLLTILLFNFHFVFPETIDGNVFLKDQSDHSGIQVMTDITRPDTMLYAIRSRIEVPGFLP
ncbi:MAG: hypothetical protein ISS19_19450, partial [Bacteroidales bacterium]|nr:hypothetical protein [Bacteroidales bacterium]